MAMQNFVARESRKSLGNGKVLQPTNPTMTGVIKNIISSPGVPIIFTSGKLRVCYGIDGPKFVDLPSYNMVIFHSCVGLKKRVSHVTL